MRQLLEPLVAENYSEIMMPDGEKHTKNHITISGNEDEYISKAFWVPEREKTRTQNAK